MRLEYEASQKVRCLRRTATYTGLLLLMSLSPARAFEPTTWPSSRDKLTFALSTYDKPIFAYAEDGKVISNINLSYRDTATVDRNGVLKPNDGSFVAAGVDAYIATTVAASSAFSFEAFVYPDLLTKKERSAILTNGNFVLEQIGTSVSFLVHTSRTGEAPFEFEIYKLQDLNPFHLAVVWEDASVKSYVNGERVFEGAGVGDLSTWRPRHLVFGSAWDRKMPWAGGLEGVAIFSRALSDAEIRADYRAYTQLISERKLIPSIKVRARLLAKSEVPKLESLAPYTRSLLVCDYAIEEVLEGRYGETKMYVVDWSVLDSSYQPLKDIPIGTVRELRVEDFTEQLQLQRENISDGVVSDFARPLFFDIGSPFRADSIDGGINHEIHRETRQNIPLADSPWPTEQEQHTRRKRIDADTVRMSASLSLLPSREQLEPFHKAFRAIPASKGVRLGKAGLAYGELPEFDLRASVPDQFSAPEIPSMPFDIIVDFNKQLLEKNIHLIFVPVPGNIEIYPDFIVGSISGHEIVVPEIRRFIHGLEKQNVEVVDLLPVYQKTRTETDELLCLPADSHWSNFGVQVAAKEIADRLKSYSIVQKAMTATPQYRTEVAEVLVSLPNPPADLTIPVTRVVTTEGESYRDVDDSPILVTGDSFTFAHYEPVGAHLSAHIAKEINMPLALLARGGYGGSVPRELANKGVDYVRRHKIVIWVIADRYLGSWQSSRWATATIP